MKYLITETQLKKLTSLISETSEEEAWELVGQDHKVIKSVVSKKGYENDKSSVEKLIPIIDNLPTEEFDYAQLRSPVALKIDDEFILIGGRTRIYASVAAGKPIKIKILKPSDL